MGPGARPHILLFASVVCCLGAAAVSGASESAPAVHALLINGGDKPSSNYLSHFHHLEDMVALLRGRGVPPERIHVFSADGQDPAADLTRRDPPPPGFWLLEGTSLGNRLKPEARLVDSRWEGVNLRPARQEALKEWFEGARQRLKPGDRLLVFVTDHGTNDPKDPDNDAISLWGEKLTVRQFKALLARLPSGVDVVMVMSQCYSGAFATAMTGGGSPEPSGDVCGFFSTTADQKAYGCYPEGRDRDEMGHAFQFIEALGRRATTAEAHLDVLAADDTPDLPLRTSDAYLSRLLSAEAAARRTDVDALIDSLLREAWQTPAAWEPEIRLLDRIGASFGTFSPRAVSEISPREKELQALARQISTYADKWKVTRVQLQESLVRDFLKTHADWRPRLEPGALDALGPDERAALLGELLPAFEHYARSQAEPWSKLETFRSHAVRGAEARWRLEVRQAVLQRMRMILVGIAGRTLVARGRERERGALERLQRCEAFVAGDPPDAAMAARPRAAPSFPPIGAELAILEEISPSWLGVKFRPVAPAVRAERRWPAGANLLDAVFPDSPAGEAGLEVGDIVLGPPGRPFQSSSELREWTMTAPRGVPLSLVVIRPGEQAGDDVQFEAALTLRLAPVDLPKLPDPPQVGDHAPSLPATLKVVGSDELPDLKGSPHILFFWATWCEPCKKAVPEVMAFAESRGLSIIAISDEEEDTIRRFLAGRAEPLIHPVARDPLRKTFISYGVSGTPTLLLVDADGVIRHRQVGYGAEKGLTIDGWVRPPTESGPSSSSGR